MFGMFCAVSLSVVGVPCRFDESAQDIMSFGESGRESLL